MFYGVIPRKLINIIKPELDKIDKQVYVGCSGGFTIEGTLNPRPCISNDVNPYTSFFGFYLSDQDRRLEVTNEDLAQFNHLLKTPLDKAAMIMMVERLAPYKKRRTPFQEFHHNYIIDNFLSLFEEQKKRVEAARESYNVPEYHCQDVHEFIKSVPGDAVFMASIPTIRGAYERDYRFVSANIDWDSPDYELFDITNERLFRLVLESGADYMLFLEGRNEYLDEHATLTTYFERNLVKDIWIYSNILNTHSSRIAAPFKKSKIKLLPQSYEFTRDTKIEIKEIDCLEANYWRLIFLKKHLRICRAPRTPMASFGMFADGMMFGIAAFTYPQIARKNRKGDEISQNMLYLISDLPLTKHRRVSKLVIILARSKLIKTIIEKRYLMDLHGFMTTGFSDKPESMKYRGVMKLWGRTPPNKLNYVADFDIGSPKKAYLEWLEKYHNAKGNKRKPRNAE